ncbi:metallophosphoesterase [Enteractinococcus helveticum]|uniref:Gram-positive cocci surface proteins LPxTG domain-containing protein n=1 Tax=Enteractinococcus helveticum TaxID=1837282 RepID=A0A1B7LV56_9MICC|nr:metallophosphoesterase [Enteractinococcus helveticum]OAV52016.1 hypothetical protein A6F49_01245 [Enteractinococcus helveticum]
MTRISRWLPASTLTVGLVASSLAVIAPAQANLEVDPESDVLIDETTTWRYLDDGTDPANGLPSRTDWTAPEFDDSSWDSAPGSFGALRGEIAELNGGYTPDNLLSQYKDSTNTNKEAFFFRSEFTVDTDELDQDDEVNGAILYDDAAIIYVNGKRVGGFHDEELAFTEEGDDRNLVYGGANASAPRYREFTVPEDLIEDGENTIAVQLHNGRDNSSDLYFELEHLTVETNEPEGPTAMLLQMGADPSERRLSWLTDSGVAESVQIASGAVDTMPENATTIETSVQDDSAHEGKQYAHATLSALTPGTYSYRVGSAEGTWSDIAQFEVHSNDVEHTFTLVGDPQLGSSGNLQSDGAGWQRALDANDQLFPESQYIHSVGDQVETYSGTPDEYLTFIAPQQLRSQPLMATLGNHDYNRSSPQDLFGQHYNLPNLADYDPTEGSYWFIYNDVLHLNISTEFRSDYDAHREFLETTIAQHGDDVSWTMLTFHRPLYSGGNHSVTGTTDGIRDNLGPIINDLDIDVVLTGHDHSYTRSYLIDGEGNQVDPAASEVIVDAEGNVTDQELIADYEGTDSSQRLEDGNYVRVTSDEDETLFVTANSSSGSKFYNLQDVGSYRDGYVPRFRDQQREQNITGVEVTQCTVTTNTVELDGTVVDKVELLRDHTAPVITAGAATVELDGEFDPLAGLEISDDCAVLTTDDVDVDGEIDTSVLGAQTVTYRVADEAGNETEFERVVTVAEAPAEDNDDDNNEDPTPIPTPGEDDDNTQDPNSNDVTDGNNVGGTDGDDSDDANDDDLTDADRVADTDRDGALANTGASIMWVVAIGLAALAIGLVLFLVKRNRLTP